LNANGNHGLIENPASIYDSFGLHQYHYGVVRWR